MLSAMHAFGERRPLFGNDQDFYATVPGATGLSLIALDRFAFTVSFERHTTGFNALLFEFLKH